jgi:hypothetical protein
LRCGDALVLLGGEMAAVSSVSARQEKTLVYNLSVEGSHTYSVSQAGVLVHNKALQIRPVPSESSITKTFDQARQEAFLTAGLTDPKKVQFTKVDPKTGTFVEFK